MYFLVTLPCKGTYLDDLHHRSGWLQDPGHLTRLLAGALGRILDLACGKKPYLCTVGDMDFITPPFYTYFLLTLAWSGDRSGWLQHPDHAPGDLTRLLADALGRILDLACEKSHISAQ